MKDLILSAMLGCFAAQAQTTQSMESCPMHAEHMKQSTQAHHAGVNERGDQAMGFSHEKTTHHFRLASDGGAIEVVANEAGDEASRQQIRFHLVHIAELFSGGEFEIPLLVHGQIPPGVPMMKERKKHVRYTYESTDLGGRVRIATTDKKALAAVHQFLRFQIADHQTGDPLTVN